MAVIDTTRFASASFGGKSQNIFASAYSAFLAWNEARLTRAALSQLSTRELDDIGIARGDIDEMFR